MFAKVSLWSVPFLLVPLSYLFYRFLPLRTTRYVIYAAVLVAAFFLNLFRVSFCNELYDTILYLFINFIFAEYFWNLLRLNQKKLFRVLLVIGLVIYAFQMREWIFGGPTQAAQLWNPPAASTFRRVDVNYSVKVQNQYNATTPSRSIILNRQIGSLPFEKQISSYHTPKGFKNTKFTYKWSITPQGVRLDLTTAGYTLWTMGEGF